MAKKHEEHENHERWLVSYADFITLLFAFFTVLYATAQSDQAKLNAVVDGMNAAFEGGMPHVIMSVLSPPDPSSSLTPMRMSYEAVPAPELSTLQRHLRGSLSDRTVQVGFVDQMLIINIPDHVLFAAGSAELHPASYGLLNSIADGVKNGPAHLQVIGTADGTPVTPGGQFGDNWELASARALVTVRYLESHGVPVDNLEATARRHAARTDDSRRVEIRVRVEEPAAAGEVIHDLEPVLPSGNP